ncbi:hypothetical protein AVEN_13298-1 [Araneus ventricosus]|uniref:Uncharacterized protein n=1 Tax=Araneus ventricosus TaxID=182803 RepID=A0A4Y2V074_ARAVE|nr:hypothetical protein AVEN_13298-1 [Araneus ventricosus]
MTYRSDWATISKQRASHFPGEMRQFRSGHLNVIYAGPLGVRNERRVDTERTSVRIKINVRNSDCATRMKMFALTVMKKPILSGQANYYSCKDDLAGDN